MDFRAGDLINYQQEGTWQQGCITGCFDDVLLIEVRKAPWHVDMYTVDLTLPEQLELIAPPF